MSNFNSEEYYDLIAKTGTPGQDICLPLWIHLHDTAYIIKKLTEYWLSEHVCAAAGLKREVFEQTAVFCAAVHDIGKATSYFQSIITQNNSEHREYLINKGFCIKEKYIHRGKTPHAWAGQWILQNHNKQTGIIKGIANVTGAHHGKPIESAILNNLIELYPSNFYGVENDPLQKQLWNKCWDQIIEDAFVLSGFQDERDIPDISVQAQILLSGLVIVADWLASNIEYFSLVSFDAFSNLTEDIYPDRVEDAWSKICFPDMWRAETHWMDNDIFKSEFGFEANEIQEAVIDTVNRCKTPGIFILEAPMGIGKTEAALGAAEVLSNRTESSGIFFGLPTQATSNGLFERLYDWAENVSSETKNAIRLAHGSAEMNEEYRKHMLKGRAYVDEDDPGTLAVHSWFQGNKKALLADFVIGTVDNFLMSSLKRKHFMLRHLGLAGKIVIIDECHAYDAYMNVYLERTIQWMAAYGVPIILLSATLPSEKRCMLINSYVKAYARYHSGVKKPEINICNDLWDKTTEYPLLTWSEGIIIDQISIPFNSNHKHVKIERLYSDEKAVELIRNKLSEGGCACIIVNTVRKAQEIYDSIKDQLPEYEVFLSHAQFTAPDRSKKEKKIIKRLGKNSRFKDRNRVILIGTQVLEQSLDYDADLMITQLCPMDLLLQRIGRLHRHHRERPENLNNPECYILTDGEEIFDEGSKSVYGSFLLTKTHRNLPEVINIPQDISPLVQRVYDESEDDIEIIGYDEYKKLLKDKKERAEKYLLPKPTGKGIEGLIKNENTLEEKFADCGVRDGQSSIEVLLVKKNEENIITLIDEDSEHIRLSPYDTPDEMTGWIIAKQRLRLPYIFSTSFNLNKTIQELEKRNINELSSWQQCSWLHGELILLLDENSQTELIGYELTYTSDRGLQYKRKEG